MKIRLGFVSNSSSSSFVIPKSALSPRQIKQIWNYQKTVKDILKKEGKSLKDARYGKSAERFAYFEEGWKITETQHVIEGSTNMDNFNFAQLLKEIGVSEEDITWSNEGDW